MRPGFWSRISKGCVKGLILRGRPFAFSQRGVRQLAKATEEALAAVERRIEELREEIGQLQRKYNAKIRETAAAGGDIRDFIRRAGALVAFEARLRRLQAELRDVEWRRFDLVNERGEGPWRAW